MASMVILMYFIISLVHTLIYTAVIYIIQTTTDMIRSAMWDIIFI